MKTLFNNIIRFFGRAGISYQPVGRGSCRAAHSFKIPATARREARPTATLAILLLVVFSVTFSASAQLQQAWVAHYNNGILNGTNSAIKMSLDSVGNIYIAGYSQNANTNLGYAVVKYAPNGTQLWSSRYDTNSSISPVAMAVDSSNSVIVTGSGTTVKYDLNGNLLWTAPYAGTCLAVDTNANAYIGGFSANFTVQKLSPSGSNVWQTSYVEPYGPTISQTVLIDSSNNIYVSGLDTYEDVQGQGTGTGRHVTLTTIKYNTNGSQVWKASERPVPGLAAVQVQGAASDAGGNIYLLSNWTNNLPYVTWKYSSGGILQWSQYDPTGSFLSTAYGFALDQNANVIVTGQNFYDYPNSTYGTYKIIGTNGTYQWTNLYPSLVTGVSAATSVTVDQTNNSYITGFSPGTNSFNNIVTIKYNTNGNMMWVQSYSSPGNGNAAGNAIAVDSSGNVYVAGCDTTTAGGTEMVLIKYAPITLQCQNGSVLLQAQGSPGENFQVEASADLLNWQQVGSGLANTNGLFQFTDTNASNYPARFYYTIPQ